MLKAVAPGSESSFNVPGHTYGALFSSAGTVATAGTVYVPGDTVTLSGGTATTNAILGITDTQVITATVNAAGSGGSNGAVTIVGTTGTGTKFQATGTISGGALTGPLTVTIPGDYTVNPTSLAAEPITGGSLAGATVTLVMGALKFAVAVPGVYSAIPGSPATMSQGSTSGAGSGATFAISFGMIAAFPSFNYSANLSPPANSIWGMYGAGRPQVTGTANENSFFGYEAGGRLGNGSSFNSAFGHNAMGIGGGTAAIANSGNNCAFGTDSLRNFSFGNGATAIGAAALKAQAAASGFANFTAIGTGAAQNYNSTNNSKSVCVGVNAGAGGASASYTNSTFIGDSTGGAATSASNVTVIGKGVGNTTLQTGSGIILIGSGAQTVDTNTSNTINIENVVTATGTNTPATSLAGVAGLWTTLQTTVAGLPAAAAGNSGYRAFVTDSTATTFAAIVAGTGANKVPVYSDGTNWRIG